MAFLPGVVFAIVVVGIVALDRGHVHWARIHSRRVAGLVVFLGLIAFAIVGSQLPSSTQTSGGKAEMSTVGVADLASAGNEPSTMPSSAPGSGNCHPVTNRGKCYRAGEVCRRGDRGSQGVGVGGEAIVCRDDNGWRWEPA